MLKQTKRALIASAVLCFALTGCDRKLATVEQKPQTTEEKAIGLFDEYKSTLAEIKSHDQFIEKRPTLDKLRDELHDLDIKSDDDRTTVADQPAHEKFSYAREKFGSRVYAEMDRLKRLGVSPIELEDVFGPEKITGKWHVVHEAL